MQQEGFPSNIQRDPLGKPENKSNPFLSNSHISSPLGFNRPKEKVDGPIFKNEISDKNLVKIKDVRNYHQGSGENSQQLELDEAMNRSIDHGVGTKAKVVDPKDDTKTKPSKDENPEVATKNKPPEKNDNQNKQKHIPQKPDKNKPEKSESTDQPKNQPQNNPFAKIKDPTLPAKPTIADPFQQKIQPFNAEKPGGFPQFQPSFGYPPGYNQSQQAPPGFEPSKNHPTPIHPHPSSQLPQQPAVLSKADKEKIEAAKALAEDLSSKLGSVPAEISDMKSKTS